MVKQLKLPEVKPKETNNKEIKGPYELPEGWKWVKLGDVCEINPRDKNLRDLSLELEVTFVPMKAVDYKKGEIISPEIRRLSQVIKGYTQFKEGDVIFAKITPCMENGKVAIARNLKKGLGFGSTEFHVLRSSSQIISEYVYFYIRQPSFRDKAQMKMTGTVGQLRVPTHFMKNVEIPIPFKDGKPDIEEQKRIIPLFESTLSKANKAKELLKDSKKAIDKILPAAIKKVIPTEEPLPEGWKWMKLGDVCEIIGGGTPSTDNPAYWDGDIPWITSANIIGLEQIRPRRTITKEGLENSATNLLPKGNLVVVTRVGLGKIALNSMDLCFSQDSQGVIINKEVFLAEYLLYFLSREIQRFKHESRGTTIQGVTKRQLKNIMTPHPPLSEQHHITAYLNSVSERVEKLKRFNDDALEKVEKISASILSKAFRGELSQGVNIGVKTKEYGIEV